MEQETISIIVPIYKVPERYLRQCIESIVNQTFKNIEILLVDDGSPDNCGTICDEYAEKDNRIKVIHKVNGGLSSARNAGFLTATGKWIMFVDGDDWIDSEMCSEIYNYGEKDSVDIVMCGMVKEYEHSSEVYKYYLEDRKIYRGKECKWLQEQLLHFNGNIAVAYCKLIKRELLEKNHILHDEILRQGAEGLEFNLRLFEKIESAVFINKPFYHYIYNENSISASHDEKNHKFVVECFKKIEAFIVNSKNKEVLMPWFYNRLDYVIITTAISGYFNPSNKEPYSEKKRKYNEYLEQDIIKRALKNKMLDGISGQRKLILWLINKKLYLPISILGYVRKFQKKYM